MKKNFKRLFALVLTLCMLASLMVPVAFAEDEAVAAPSANVAETYPIRLKDLNHTDPTTAEGLDLLMVKTNAAGETRYYGPDLTDSQFATAYADGTLNWKLYAYNYEATYRNDRAYQLRLRGEWTAFQIRVSDAGSYQLNIATDRVADAETEVNAWTNANTWAGDVSAYIVPVAVANDAIANAVIPEVAEGETAPTAEVVGINSLMIEENSVGTVNLASDADSITFAKTRMEGGEYVVIVGFEKNDISISEMSLLGTPDVLENVATYALRPFDMTNYDVTTYAGTINEQMLADGAFTDRVVSSTVIGAADLNYSYFSAVGSSYHRASGAWQMDAKNGAVAVVIDVAESGQMCLSLKTDKTNYANTATPWSNAYKTFTADIQAWMIPYDVAIAGGTAASQKKASLTALVADGTYSLGVKNMLANQETVTFDKTYVEAGKYVVAFEALNEQGAWCEMSLSKVVVDALPGNDKLSGTIATYDFEIYNDERYEPIFVTGTDAEGNTTYGDRGFSNSAFTGLEGVYEAGEGVEDIIAKDFAAGIINYKLESWGTMNTLSYRKTEMNGEIQGKGLRIQKKESTEDATAYAAFRLNVPATAMYNVDLNLCYNSVGTLNLYIFGADYEGTIADNMTAENLAATNATNFASVLTAGDNILVFEFGATTGKETINLLAIELSINSESVTYDFGLANNEGFMEAWYETNGGVETAFPESGPNAYKWTSESGSTMNPYAVLATLYREGKLNWALNTASGSFAAGAIGTESKNFRLYTNRIRCLMENADYTQNYTSFTLKVSTSGTYNVAVNYSKTSDSVKTYVFKAPAAYAAYADRLDAATLLSYMTEANQVATPSYDAPEVNFTYTFEEAGDYIIAFAPTRTDKNTAMYLSSIVMEPAAINYLADGEGYETFEEAAEAATESITLLQDTAAGEVIVPAGVTLDLNGYNLDAASVEFAAAADIIDSADGKALLRSSAEITFNEDNAQLPLYDIDTNTYKLFNVEVESCATTGKASATKYWFKVNFSNAAALDMIGQFTELRIQADMTGVIKADSGDYVAGDEWAAVASADAAFTNAWAANSNSYIVVSAVGSNLSSFRLNPGITANGVVISGDTMYKDTIA